MTLQASDVFGNGTVPGWYTAQGYQFETDWYWSFVNYHYWTGTWDVALGSWNVDPILGYSYWSIDWNAAILYDYWYSSGLDAGLTDWTSTYLQYDAYVADDTGWGGAWTTGDIYFWYSQSYYWSGNDGTFFWDCNNLQYYGWNDNGDYYYSAGTTWYNLAGGWGYGYWWSWNWSTGYDWSWFFI